VILYYFPATRAFPVLWLLEEINADYQLEIVDLKKGAQNSGLYRRLNSMMKVPTLVNDGVVVNETGAILQYVAERHPSHSLLPAIGDTGRAVCLRWLFFIGSNLEPAMAEKFNGWTPNPYYNGWGDFDRVKQAINAALTPGPWLLGERFSVADIYLSSDLRIARLGNLIAAEDEPTASYLKRTEDRAGFVRASKIDADY
jgi:glutathione S-transferase